MKKHTLALALAGLSCGATFAQTTNTFYGVLDADLMTMDSGYGQSVTLGSGGLRQTCQFVERSFRIEPAGAPGDQPHQRRALGASDRTRRSAC